MKSPVVFSSLLALAGTVAFAESADAAILDIDSHEELKQAVCSKDWYKAIEVSSKLITSPNITPEYRQTLLDQRRQFYTHVQGNTKENGENNCSEFKSSLQETQKLNYKGPEPRFSARQADVSKTEQLFSPASVTALTNIWTVGVRVEGNSVKGTILNNGLTTARNVTLTIRSQQKDNSEDVRTVAVDTVRAWDEAEFVAAFNDTPGSWMIESIEIN